MWNKSLQNRVFLDGKIGTALTIVVRKSPNSFLRNRGIPLSYVGPRSVAIRICADGWIKLSRSKGYSNPNKFFSLKRGIKAISFAVAHESIHQVLFKLEGERVSLALDAVSGSGEVV